MSTEKIYQHSFLPSAKYLLKELEYYGENQFKRKTNASDWTIGQLYHHLIQGSLNYHIKAIRNCLEKKNGELAKGKSGWGMYVFLMKSFPPFKIKGPEGYQPAQIENTEKAKDMMYGFLKEMQKLSVEIDKYHDPSYKIKSIKFGYLNAKEWYELTVLHMNHHLKQKKKIDKILRTFVKDEVYNDSLTNV